MNVNVVDILILKAKNNMAKYLDPPFDTKAGYEELLAQDRFRHGD